MTGAGRVALITGAGSGIGAHLAAGLADHGVALGLLGRRPEAIEAVALRCRAEGVDVVPVVADVRSPGAVADAVKEVEHRLGPIDLLVHNAGQVDRPDAPLWEADPDDWWAVFETNFRGTVNLCRAVLPGMVARRGGRVLNVSSILAVRPDARYSAYSSSKAALLVLSDLLAEPLAGHGVSVFDISPGMVDTAMTRSMAVCAGRTEWTSPDLIVDAVVRLADGELDPLRGTFVHVGHDDLTALAAGEPLHRTGARTLRLRPYGPADPIA